MKELLKKSKFVKKFYGRTLEWLKVYFPNVWAKLAYRVAYGKHCNLVDPQTFSEKLLWLSLHTYRNNPLVLKLCDKYLVREYVRDKVGDGYLNELYNVYDSIENIKFEKLPDSFALKLSQGSGINFFCEDKRCLRKSDFEKSLLKLSSGQKLYDKTMADIGGIPVDKLEKYYVCEKYLKEQGRESPTDYKIYCFNGVPKAILVIADRFTNINGVFMNTDWTFLSDLSGKYHKVDKTYSRPVSLDKMLYVARKLSDGFPFVRVDMYDIGGRAIFGEMTFFPSGCIRMQETEVDGKSMGELLDISILVQEYREK